MTELDGDRILDPFGVVLVLAIVDGLALIGLGATSTQEGSRTAPGTDWSLERVDESHVRVWHEGGEPVRAEHLSVAGGGRHRRIHWTATVLIEGEHGTVRAAERSRVTLLWQRPAGERRALERWTP